MRILIFLAVFAVPLAVLPQNADYDALISQGKFKEAYSAVKLELDRIYETRNEGKRIPNDYITIGSAEDRIDLNRLFAERKAEPYFIEENPELFKLHRKAALCAHKNGEYDSAVRHYYQCFRFKQIEFTVDSDIFYDLSRVFLDAGYERAYLNSLERACSLDQSNARYSLELARALYPGRDKKRAVFYFERYFSLHPEAEDINDYILLANLYSSIGRYLDTAGYYRKYLEKKPDDAVMIFALAFICCRNIGSLDEALVLFAKALELLPENEVLRRQKAYEYSADILYRNLRYQEALDAYIRAASFDKSAEEALSDLKNKIKSLKKETSELRGFLLKQKDPKRFEMYQAKYREISLLEYELMQAEYEKRKFSSGKIRWNTAEILEKLERYAEAVDFYQTSADYDYKAREARERIIKLQLKIKRGY